MFIFYNRLSLWDKGEKTEKQPVSIHDVISGIVAIIRNSDTAGKTYQFVGYVLYIIMLLKLFIYIR